MKAGALKVAMRCLAECVNRIETQGKLKGNDNELLEAAVKAAWCNCFSVCKSVFLACVMAVAVDKKELDLRKFEKRYIVFTKALAFTRSSEHAELLLQLMEEFGKCEPVKVCIQSALIFAQT